MKKWSMKPNVYTGIDCLSRLAQFENEKICFVCDPYLIGTESFKKIVSYLPNSSTMKIFSEIVPDPPIETVAEGVARMEEHQPTVLVTVGGGSAIDTAKAMLFTYKKMTNRTVKKFIAIPTTSGTGSEVTSASVITDTKNKIKYPIFHPDLIPDEALLDAELAVSSPPTVTAYSGMDVLTHALEALVAKNRSIYTDSLAEKAIELVFEHLETCYLEGTNLNARIKMHQASCMAGLAFDAAGLGICHSIAHQVGAQFKVPHGLANLMLLPHVIQANSQDSEAMKKYAWISKKLGFGHASLPDHLAAANLQREISKLSKRLNCPLTLAAFGIDEVTAREQSDEIARNALKDATYPSNPVPFDEAALKQVYQQIID